MLLTGRSDFRKKTLEKDQIDLLAVLQKNLPDSCVLSVSFPFIEDGNEEDEAAYHIPFWQMALRNYWQAHLCILFNDTFGKIVARCISNRIAGEKQSFPSSLYVIAGSAGAAMILAASPFLKKQVPDLKIIIISLGGVFGSNRGFDCIAAFYQLEGSNDIWAKLPAYFLISRWLPFTALQKAKNDNRYRYYCTGDHTHFGRKGYLSETISVKGITFAQLTQQKILELLTENRYLTPEYRKTLKP